MVAMWAWSEAAYGSDGRADGAMLLGLRASLVAHPTLLPIIRSVMLGATFLGAFPTLCVVVLGAGAALTLGRERRAAASLVIGSGCGIGLANLLKGVVERPRPMMVEHWASFGSYSFPSGHAADSTIAYLLLAAVAAPRIGRSLVRRCAPLATVALPLLVGCSRVVLEVHWPTDVFGGWCFGSAWVILCRRLEPGRSPSARRG